MPSLVEDPIPEAIQPFLFHGLDLDYKDKREALGECPLCGKHKFHVNTENGLWDCKVCSESGNLVQFLEKYHASLNGEGLSELKNNRKLLDETSLTDWGIAFSHFNQRWYVPGYNSDGIVRQLYRYTPVGNNKRILHATPTLSHQLHGVNLYEKKKPKVFLCEGPWDGVALYEILKRTKQTDSGLTRTGNSEISLLKDINVLAVPGCTTFYESWCKLFTGKDVVLLYDSDHPRTNPKTGTEVASAGYSGMKRVAKILLEGSDAPSSISYLNWGVDGYDPTLPSGTDIRDVLSQSSNRIENLSWILSKIEPIPQEWTSETKGVVKKGKSNEGLDLLPCTSFESLRDVWKRAMRWTDGLDGGLAVMLASIVSTKSVGDQLWIRAVSPPSTGKSVLCEAISTATEYVMAKSTLRGFHSGYDDGSGENHSPLKAMMDKTLVIKDGDTLLQSPNLGQILSEARDIYDRVSRSSYRSKQSKDWAGINLTIILCGTASLRSLNQSELGERFLDYVIMEGIDEDLEDEILDRVVNQADRNLAIEADSDPQTHSAPEMTIAKQLTGGYVTYLRENSIELLSQVVLTEEARELCKRLGKFVSYMRARPSDKQEETAEREFSARLASQHVRLAKCLAVVLNKKTTDIETMTVVKKVAFDTARGQTLDIIKILADYGHEGMEATAVAHSTHRTQQQARTMLRFLTRIHALETFHPKTKKGLNGTLRWRLTERMSNLYHEICQED